MGTQKDQLFSILFDSVLYLVDARLRKSVQGDHQLPSRPANAPKDVDYSVHGAEATETFGMVPHLETRDASSQEPFGDLFASASTGRVPSQPGVHAGTLTTRNFMDSADIGGHFFLLQVDNLKSVLLYVGQCGQYDLTREPLNTELAIIDDEEEPVPIVIRRSVPKTGWTEVEIEVRPNVPEGLRQIRPYNGVAFK